jgi:hypothetical protein
LVQERQRGGDHLASHRHKRPYLDRITPFFPCLCCMRTPISHRLL